MIDNETLRYASVAVIVLATGFTEGVTGFGSAVLALPAVALLLGLKVAVPVLVLQGWALALLIVLLTHQHISWREYAIITVLMAAGLPVGMWAARVLPEDSLKWALAVLMVAVGGHGLYLSYRRTPVDSQSEERDEVSEGKGRRGWLAAILPLGGIVHGAFGTGGPLVVIYATRALTHKTVFRVTLCLIWLTLNSVLIASYLLHATLTRGVLATSGLCLPFTVAGMSLGHMTHYRIDETLFRRVVYLVLVLSGLALVWSLRIGR